MLHFKQVFYFVLNDKSFPTPYGLAVTEVQIKLTLQAFNFHLGDHLDKVPFWQVNPV